MDTSVNFTSDLFNPFLPESAQVNPGCYGAELAWWLSRELAQKGLVTSYPNSEDWGWFVEYFVEDNEYWLCCGSVNETESEWHIFLDPKAKGMFGRNKASVKEAEPLLSALRDILSTTENISNIHWYSEDV